MSTDVISLPKTRITERTLFARLKRKLAHENLELKMARTSSRWSQTLGRFYTVEVYNNRIEHTHINLARWGREMGLLKAHEEIV